MTRRLGPWAVMGLVVGITIGSGIFRTPAVVAARVPDPLLMLSVWVIGGVITLCGALSFAELSASLPHTGGIYVYLREGWGRLPAFLFGWCQLLLIRGSALAAISSVFGAYALRSFGIDPVTYPTAARLVAVGAIAIATITNIVGVRLGAAIVGASTVAKYGALAFLVGASFLLGGSHGGSLSHFTEPAASAVDPGLFGLALISALWAYDGFADTTFVAGEVQAPQKNLPRALILGTTAIVAIYLAANAAYLYLNPLQSMAASPLVAADTMSALFGQAGAAAVSVVVMISTYGSVNGNLLVNPRIFFAMAEDRLFFRPLARVHPRFQTPHVAILLAAALGTLFVLTRTFEQLTDTFVLTIWPFYGLSVAAIYRLRARRPDLPRPYKAAGYPFVPMVFILGVIYLVGNALVADPVTTGLVLGIALTGIPVYVLFFRERR